MQSILLGAILFTRHVSTIPFYISKQNEERSLLGEPMNQDSNQFKASRPKGSLTLGWSTMTLVRSRKMNANSLHTIFERTLSSYTGKHPFHLRILESIRVSLKNIFMICWVLYTSSSNSGSLTCTRLSKKITFKYFEKNNKSKIH
jgi:hypothetical protein